MTLTDIKDAIVSKLQVELPSCNIYAEEDPMGFQRPALLIRFASSSVQNQQFYKEKIIKVKILYYSLTGTYQDIWDISESLSNIFGSQLTVGPRTLTIKSTNSETIEADGITCLQFVFELTFIEGNELLEIQTALGETEYMLSSEELGYTQSNISLIGELELKEQEE